MRFQFKKMPPVMLLAGLTSTLPLFAQQMPTPASTASQPAAAQAEASDARASRLIGMQVKNAQGEKLGKIQDLVIDVASEQVNYAVLSFGGMLGGR